MERKHYVLGIVGIVLGGVLLAGVILSQPTATEEAPEPKPENDELYTRLAEAGIDDVVVDITDERILVRYELPDDGDKDQITFFIFGEAAEVAPDTPLTVVQVYDDSEPVEEASVKTETVRAFKNGTISYEAFRQEVTRTDLSESEEE